MSNLTPDAVTCKRPTAEGTCMRTTGHEGACWPHGYDCRHCGSVFAEHPGVCPTCLAKFATKDNTTDEREAELRNLKDDVDYLKRGARALQAASDHWHNVACAAVFDAERARLENERLKNECWDLGMSLNEVLCDFDNTRAQLAAKDDALEAEIKKRQKAEKDLAQHKPETDDYSHALALTEGELKGAKDALKIAFATLATVRPSRKLKAKK